MKEYRHDLVEVLSGSDLMVITTDHDYYYREKLEPEEVGTIMNNRLVIDTRGFLDESWDKHFKVVRLAVG
jgi:UDP-N-acetyl-D-mannosaminuronate dehydrogenase